MPLNSINQQIQGYLNGLVVSGTTNVNPIKANIVPPVGDDLATQPLVYIWGGRLKEQRQTMAGQRSTSINTSSAFRDLVWQVDLYIKYAMANDDPAINYNFPLVVDSIMQKLRGVTMPVIITDPQTGWVSQITEIGEEFHITKNDIITLQDQRFYLLETHMRMMVREKIQQ